MDNSLGRTDFSATRSLVPGSADLTGLFTAATVRFKALAPCSTQVTFLRSGARESKLWLAGRGIDPLLSGAVIEVAALPATPTPTPTPAPTTVPPDSGGSDGDSSTGGGSGSGGGSAGGSGDGGSAETPAPTATPAPQDSGPEAPPVATSLPLPLVAGQMPAEPDERYFSETGYRIGRDAFWDYFQKRGGVRTLGYPVSREFILQGFPVQIFQRMVLQLQPDGSVARLNLLDEGLMPYTRINFSSFPGPEPELVRSAPSPADPEYGARAIEFLEQNVPDRWEGMDVNFLRAFGGTVRYEDAFPDGDGEEWLLPLLNLEIWGLPTSRPAYDPANHGFVYQRFQRGILHYDAATGATQGLLLGDYLKGVIAGRDLPPDLEEQARGSIFYRQYDRTRPGWLARPEQLPGTNLLRAFEPEWVMSNE